MFDVTGTWIIINSLQKMKWVIPQGNLLYPKLFAGNERPFQKLQWGHRELFMDENLLNNLRFADDVILLTNNPAHLKEMLEEIKERSEEIGLTINMIKTKTMLLAY